MTVPAAPPLLAIETSCDDTAAAVWAEGRLASSVVAGQQVHEAFGGVVPELASRAHEQLVVPTVEAGLAEARMTLDDIGAVAVTVGPGLAGSLLVGLGVAKGIALGRGLPLVGVHHLDGHAASVYVRGDGPPVPFLCLTVSGGHTHLSVVGEGLHQTVLGRTRDDAAGEAFDKVARLLGLPYPGGPHVDRLAAEGDPAFLKLPSPRLTGKHGERPPFDVSFSGLKTAVRYWLDDHPAEGAAHVADVCASFQATVARALVGALREAVRETGIRHVAIVGGVSANRGLRAAAQAAADADGFTLHVPDPAFSVDNAAMIAVAGAFRWASGARDGLDLAAQPALAL
ncbi:MAG TPA: tRNA (adenosine(37)-N6)-threonylcarbamoyltransferase complex transferase subunit TsaD [Rubricoccaceae bacterium]